jgi:gas vesicle protein
MEERNNFAYFLLGLGVGVAAGVLWAPRAGAETRQYLLDKAGEGTDYMKARTEESKEYLRHRTEELRDSAADLYEKGKHQVVRQRDNLTSAVEAGKQAYRDAVNDIKSAAGDEAV